MSGWVCQWKPFWIPVEDSFKKAYMEEWVFISDVPSEGPSSTDQGEVIPETPRVSKHASSLPLEPAKLHDKACFWERIEAPLPPLRPGPKCDFIHPRQPSPFPERLVLPFSNEVILSGYEELASSGNDLFTSCAKLSDHEILVQHMVDIEKATAEFREAHERKHTTSSHMKQFQKARIATLSIVQRRLSIYNLNPGPRRGKEDAFEQQIAGRWHIITLQEASEYVDHELFTNRFHVTLCAGCAILVNKDTLYPNIDVKSIYLHDTRRDLPAQVIEGEQGWVLQGVLSRAIFRRQPVSGQKYFTVLSLHISNIYATKKGIAKKFILTLRAIMISQEVDLVAGDFNGTAWRHSGKDKTSVLLAKLLCAVSCPRHRAPHRCGDLDPFRKIGPTSVDFSNRLALSDLGK